MDERASAMKLEASRERGERREHTEIEVTRNSEHRLNAELSQPIEEVVSQIDFAVFQFTWT